MRTMHFIVIYNPRIKREHDGISMALNVAAVLVCLYIFTNMWQTRCQILPLQESGSLPQPECYQCTDPVCWSQVWLRCVWDKVGSNLSGPLEAPRERREGGTGRKHRELRPGPGVEPNSPLIDEDGWSHKLFDLESNPFEVVQMKDAPRNC